MISFFGSLSPMPLVTLILFWLIHYWLDKYNLLRRNSNPLSLSKCISRLMIRVMELDIIIFGLGNLITMILVQIKQPPVQAKHSVFYRLLHLSYIEMSLVSLIIALLYKLIIELI